MHGIVIDMERATLVKLKKSDCPRKDYRNRWQVVMRASWYQNIFIGLLKLRSGYQNLVCRETGTSGHIERLPGVRVTSPMVSVSDPDPGTPSGWCASYHI